MAFSYPSEGVRNAFLFEGMFTWVNCFFFEFSQPRCFMVFGEGTVVEVPDRTVEVWYRTVIPDPPDLSDAWCARTTGTRTSRSKTTN